MGEEEKVVVVPPEKIVPLPYNVCKMDWETDLMLREDMKLEHTGRHKIDPILLRRLTPEEKQEYEKQGKLDVEYMLIDGHSRWMAACDLHWKGIRAIITDMTLEEARELNYKKNKVRGKVDPMREAAYFHYLHKEKKMTVSEITERFGMSEKEVDRILSRLRITPEARNILRLARAEGTPVSPTHYEIIGSTPPEKQKDLAEIIVKHKLSKRHAEVAKSALQKGLPSEKAVEVVKTVKKAKIPPKEAKKIVHAVAVKPEIIEELPKLPKEEVKARVEEAVRPPEDVFLSRVEAAKRHYPPIVVDYVATRYKGRYLEDVLKAVFWTLWSRLDEAGREEATREAIRLAGEKGFELPIVG